MVGVKAKAQRNELEDRCRLLNWQTLEKRREFLSLVQCYKIVFGIDSLPFRTFLNLLNVIELEPIYAKVAILNCYKYSFFVRIVNAWNNLL